MTKRPTEIVWTPATPCMSDSLATGAGAQGTSGTGDPDLCRTYLGADYE